MKRNISNQPPAAEPRPSLPDTFRNGAQGFKVPEGYFDSLSPRIADRITKNANRSFLSASLPVIRKPIIWAPALATAVVAVLLLFVIPDKKPMPVPIFDEWTELNMAYDASYAEEVLLAESHSIDNALDNTDVGYVATASTTEDTEPTDEEISEYLKAQEIDPELLY